MAYFLSSLAATEMVVCPPLWNRSWWGRLLRLLLLLWSQDLGRSMVQCRFRRQKCCRKPSLRNRGSERSM